MESMQRSGITKERIERIIRYLPELRDGQLVWVEKIVIQFRRPRAYIKLEASDLVSECFLEDFGDSLRIHHCFSDEAFTKDKFEFTSVNVWNQCGRTAIMAGKNNPGHDLTLDQQRISLKTQADRNLRAGQIEIHKYMELGKGLWTNQPEQLEMLRSQFIKHLESYERILILRCIGRPLANHPYWKYELVEIPKKLLLKAKTGKLEMMLDSIQMPKPGYCYVKDRKGNLQYQLYFDGGTERKLKVQKIQKADCIVHATWEFIIRELDEAVDVVKGST